MFMRKYFALFATYRDVEVNDQSFVSLSAPVIVSNDNFLRDAIGQAKKLKFPLKLVGYFQPLLEDGKDSEVFIGVPDGFSTDGIGFNTVRNRLFDDARSRGIELLYQGFLEKESNEE